jgi:hypothetical protein
MRIGGTLDLAALAHLAGGDARMRHFQLLTHDRQVQAIRGMLAQGTTEYGVAAATGLSVEFIRQVLGENADREPRS